VGGLASGSIPGTPIFVFLISYPLGKERKKKMKASDIPFGHLVRNISLDKLGVICKISLDKLGVICEHYNVYEKYVFWFHTIAVTPVSSCYDECEDLGPVVNFDISIEKVVTQKFSGIKALISDFNT
jgi:hypothetical protein